MTFFLYPGVIFSLKMDYNPSEYCDMLIIYGECNGNSSIAAQEYAMRFPHRRTPNVNVFLRLINRVRQTGSVLPIRRGIGAGRERYARTHENEEAILLMCEENSSTSIREMSRRLNISKSSVQLVLKENEMHAYHFTKVQNLLPQDYTSRVNFCTWLLAQEPGFIQTILFTDESCFMREGSFNMHNSHIWSNENPHTYHIRNYQHRFSINLWAGIQNNLIIGPFEMPARLNGNVYNNFLINDLPELLEDIPLNNRQRLIFQQDGAPPHNSRFVQRTLNEKFPGKWIGRGGPINWPARSPDLTPLDYFLWGHIKEYTYRNQINNRLELEQRITEALATISQEMITNATNNLLRRAQLCIDCDGGHFEHLL